MPGSEGARARCEESMVWCRPWMLCLGPVLDQLGGYGYNQFHGNCRSAVLKKAISRCLALLR